MDVKARLGHNLRRIRQSKGLSQEQFALEHDIDRTYISGIERGVRNPTVTVVEKIAKALGVSIGELLD